MNRAFVENRSPLLRQSAHFYEVTYIPGGYSTTLTRRVPTDQYADDDLAVDDLVNETWDRGDEPLAIDRIPEGKNLWRAKGIE